MYLPAGIKLCHMFICDNHIGLLAFELDLVDAPVMFLHTKIELFWEYQNNMTLLMFFIDNHKPWFYN